MLGRNVDNHVGKDPIPHLPRSKFDMGISKRLQTQGHGRLYPFYIRMIYPGDTWQIEASDFVRMDTSAKVPLDDVYRDTYFFFVPFRIIDKDFPKILGEAEPEDYDDVSYGFHNVQVPDDASFNINCLLSYLNYSQLSATYSAGTGAFNYDFADEICPYALMAYYKIYNDWFRDENLDASIPYGDLMQVNSLGNTAVYDNPLFDTFSCLQVNRYHDYFSSGSIAPQKGPAVTIPLGTSAPLVFQNDNALTLATSQGAALVQPGTYAADTKIELSGTSALGSGKTFADLSAAAGTINELRLAFSLQELYEKRATFGTRYIETIRGQWGIEVPDSFFLRPEYLGGSRMTLNNVPVLSTSPTGSNLGQMAGTSSTLGYAGKFTKTFIEFGFILGLSCTRVKHSYAQGKRKEIWDYKSHLDLYNPVFANIGFTGVREDEIVNKGYSSLDADGQPLIFNYNEPNADLRCNIDSFAGLFGILSDQNTFKNQWHYGDYYAAAPSFSATWLKEDQNNLARTLTGQLIPYAGDTSGDRITHQFMFAYYIKETATRIMPSNPMPGGLTGRL